MKPLGLLIIAIVVIAIGASVYFFLPNLKFGEVDPKEMLLSYSNKFNDVNKIKITYHLKIPLLSTIFSGFSELDMEFYKYNNDYKIYMSVMGMGVAVYNKSGVGVSCTEGSIFPTQSSSISCQISEEKPVGIGANKSLIESVVVKYVGEKKIANRACADFIFSMNESMLKSISSPVPLGMWGLTLSPQESTQNESRVFYEICLDKEYGYPALMNISTQTYSKISGKTTENVVLSLEAKSVSFDVRPEDLEIPVAFALGDVDCEENFVKLNITSFRDYTNQIIDLTLSKYSGNFSTSKTISRIDAYKTTTVEIPITVESGFYTVKACIANECQESYCSVF